jgi:hypothetical protein
MALFGFLGGLSMRGRKRKSGVWHHRVPDFKLVYCGPKESFPEKETNFTIKKDVSEITKHHDLAECRKQQQKTID